MKHIISLILTLSILSVAIPAPALAVTEELFLISSPAGGEEYTVGQQVEIKWSTMGAVPEVYLAVLGYQSKNPSSYDDTCAFINLTPLPISNNGVFNWTVQVDRVDGGTNINCTNYKIAVYRAPDFAAQQFSEGYFTVVPGTGAPAPAPTPPASQPSGAHNAGTNILGADGTVYRIETGNSRSPYTSAGAFMSYKFNRWPDVVKANASDMALPLTTYTPSGATQPVTYFIPPRNGSLIVDKGTVYLIVNGLRTAFTSAEVFLGFGYSFKYVYPGDTSFMMSQPHLSDNIQKHPDGTLINMDGTLYVMKYGSRSAFPSMEVMDSWGYWPEDAVPANSHDRSTPVGEVLRLKMVNQLNI